MKCNQINSFPEKYTLNLAFWPCSLSLRVVLHLIHRSSRLKSTVIRSKSLAASLAEDEEIQSGHKSWCLLMWLHCWGWWETRSRKWDSGRCLLPSAALSLWWRVNTGSSGLEIDICIPLKPNCPAGYICSDCWLILALKLCVRPAWANGRYIAAKGIKSDYTLKGTRQLPFSYYFLPSLFAAVCHWVHLNSSVNPFK